LDGCFIPAGVTHNSGLGHHRTLVHHYVGGSSGGARWPSSSNGSFHRLPTLDQDWQGIVSQFVSHLFCGTLFSSGKGQGRSLLSSSLDAIEREKNPSKRPELFLLVLIFRGGGVILPSPRLGEGRIGRGPEWMVVKPPPLEFDMKPGRSPAVAAVAGGRRPDPGAAPSVASLRPQSRPRVQQTTVTPRLFPSSHVGWRNTDALPHFVVPEPLPPACPPELVRPPDEFPPSILICCRTPFLMQNIQEDSLGPIGWLAKLGPTWDWPRGLIG